MTTFTSGLRESLQHLDGMGWLWWGLGRVRCRCVGVFWRAVAAGCSSGDAAAVAGVSPITGWRWFAQAGGMSPVSLQAGSGRFLCLAEREQIALGVAAGSSVRRIAGELGRPASTISREITRNSDTGHHRHRYRAISAQLRAEERARRPKPVEAGRPIRGCVPGCRIGSNSGGARKRSPAGCRWTSPTMRTCGSPTRPSTGRCTCKGAASCAVSWPAACAPGGRCANPAAGSAPAAADVDHRQGDDLRAAGRGR